MRPASRPLTGAPATESSNPHVPFASPAFFPGRLATPNYFDALGGTGQDGRTSLNVTVVQHRSDAPGSLTSTRRAYSQVGLDLYYSGYLGSYTTQHRGHGRPGPRGAAGHLVRHGVRRVVLGRQRRVVGDPSVGMQQVLVTYTGLPGSGWHGTWRSVELVQDPADSTLWRGDAPRRRAGVAGPLPRAGRERRRPRHARRQPGRLLHTRSDGRAGHRGPDRHDARPRARAGQSRATARRSRSSAVLRTSGAAQTPRRWPDGGWIFALGTSSVSAVTDDQGRAAADLPVSALPGAMSLTASFDGDATHASSSSAPRAVTGRAGSPRHWH